MIQQISTLSSLPPGPRWMVVTSAPADSRGRAAKTPKENHGQGKRKIEDE